MQQALFFNLEKDNQTRCFLCNHNCLIASGGFGVCHVRQNINGNLYSLNYGRVVAAHADPVEKKPLYHFLPGTIAYSVACLGCNFACDFCQNWQISQYAQASKFPAREHRLEPAEVIAEALKNNAKSIAYTYTEPTVFFEYAYECAVLARKKGLKNIFVTNGFMGEAALRHIAPYLDAANVDIKSFKETFYRSRCKAKLIPVLENIRLMKRLKIWVEVTTLIIPGENDGFDELTDLAEFISMVDKEMPWHISAFHPDYHMQDKPLATREQLEVAYRIGKKAGLKNIYLGNVAAADRSVTFCPQCNKELIQRNGFMVRSNYAKDGICQFCHASVAGVWK